MKKTTFLAVTLALGLGSLNAQTVPTFINYQGVVADSAGVGLGNGTPVNRKMVFRIYDVASGGTSLWTEEQTVTILNGEFSVLLGQGIDGTGGAQGEPHPAIASVFTSLEGSGPDGASRFIGVTVDEGGGEIDAADVEIAPRQQITSTAYAFRADVANKITAGADSTFTDTTVTGGTFVGSSMTSPAITGGNFQGGTFTGGSYDTLDTGQGANELYAMNQDVQTTDAVRFATVDTGLGANELYAMNQNVRSTDNAVFNTVNTGQGPNELYAMNQNVRTTDDAVFRRVDTGQGANELYAMDQDVRSFDDVNFKNITATGSITSIGTIVAVASADVTMAPNGFNSNGTTNEGTVYTSTGPVGTGLGIAIYGPAGLGAFAQPNKFQAPISMLATGWIATARGFVAYSDRRLKRDIQASAMEKDLAAIQQLRVTDYRMVDPSGDGQFWRKGFIAQEVEKVIPGAVTVKTEFVPDIFSVATALIFDPTAKTLALTLEKDHGLKTGDRVRLHMDGKRVDLNVSAVSSGRKFVVEECDSAPEKVLVYGKQVNDFRTVDYDRIFTTSVGAVQELARKLENQEAEFTKLRAANTVLSQKLAALEARDLARDVRLAAIEKRLAADPLVARTVLSRKGE